MKHDYIFHYRHNGKRHEYHILADSWNEAHEQFVTYISTLSTFWGIDVSPEK